MATPTPASQLEASRKFPIGSTHRTNLTLEAIALALIALPPESAPELAVAETEPTPVKAAWGAKAKAKDAQTLDGLEVPA